MDFSIAVPTSTIIATLKGDPFKVCVIEQNTKHQGRLTLVGGRVNLPSQNHRDCALAEWTEEVGGQGATLKNLRLWAVKTDPSSDVRPSTLGKLTHNSCPEALRDQPATGHYGAPDCIYTAVVEGKPHPNDDEAKSAIFIDVRELVVTPCEEQSKFGAQHDLILAVFRRHLEGRPVQAGDFADFRSLRAMLLNYDYASRAFSR
jgi:ADP-ribose pyrophosphatase YjhB (NUDIX family)